MVEAATELTVAAAVVAGTEAQAAEQEVKTTSSFAEEGEAQVEATAQGHQWQRLGIVEATAAAAAGKRTLTSRR